MNDEQVDAAVTLARTWAKENEYERLSAECETYPSLDDCRVLCAALVALHVRFVEVERERDDADTAERIARLIETTYWHESKEHATAQHLAARVRRREWKP